MSAAAGGKDAVIHRLNAQFDAGDRQPPKPGQALGVHRIRPGGKPQAADPAALDQPSGRFEKRLQTNRRKPEKVAAVKGQLHVFGVVRSAGEPLFDKRLRIRRRKGRGKLGDGVLITECAAVRTSGMGQEKRNDAGAQGPRRRGIARQINAYGRSPGPVVPSRWVKVFHGVSSSPRRDKARLAASCSAAFLLFPEPWVTRSLICNSTSNTLAWSGPLEPRTR